MLFAKHSGRPFPTCRFALLVFILSFAFVPEGRAQVVIRERVAIQAAEAPPPMALMGEWVYLYQDYFVIRKSGIMWFEYTWLSKYAVESFPTIPQGHHLEVRVGGRDTVYSLAGMWIDSSSDYGNLFINTCLNDTVWYDHTLEILRDFDYGPVAEGDTVRMYYHAEFDNPIVVASYNTDPSSYGWGWRTTLGTRNLCTPYDATDFLEVMWAFPNLDTLALLVTCEPDTIVYGEASKIRVTASYGDRSGAELDTTKLLTFSVDSTRYCSFIAPNGDTVASALTGVTYADARAGRVKLVARGEEPQQTVPIMLSARLAEDSTVQGCVKMAIRVFTILLGETKYYRAENNQEGGLCVRELSTPKPKGSLSDVGFTVEAVIGSRLGVYHEHRDSSSRNLESDQIRLIGRYWSPDTTFKVKLTAVDGTRRMEYTITIQKPDSIGTPDSTPQNDKYNKMMGVDINNSAYNIDSLVIFWAGTTGVPPGVVKGIMKKESWQFDPAYRYEPVRDARMREEDDDLVVKMKASPYWIGDQGTMQNPQPPAYVANMKDGGGSPIQYPGFIGTAWQYFDTHRSYYTKPYKDMFKESRKKYFDKALKELRVFAYADSVVRAGGRADSLLWNHLKYEFKGGLDSIVAQTRVVSSYGLMQLMYVDASTSRITRYPRDLVKWPEVNRLYPPERLNQPHDYISYAIRHLIGKFGSTYPNHPELRIAENFYRAKDYEKGFDETWRRVLNAYNGNLNGAGVGLTIKKDRDYGSRIMQWYYELLRSKSR